ncbi:polysaccharide deacetylase family protein [Fervidibacillus halotolerans]|uniref:Polysaccharide deacetylase family protein n=1 Tax=Fervidibacillus halotolerans TaxID=2980027 RepID=A0A9E8M1A6_9BACI|nr:polysaccharide deacetylase family protein [Fervidibacillus halotolerans]WAA13557.1 polysaccharide deacetylase family protein [Fervidibacillus halotolerans]
MKKQSFKRPIILITIMIFGYFIVQNPLSELYVEKLRTEAITATAIKDSLYMEIEQRRKEYEKEPENARIDKVWKKIPGYNGLRVDVESTYQKMKIDGMFDEKKLVFKQVPPKIHLEDLPPAPIYRGHPEKPTVAITINVAWGNEYISSILATLKRQQVHATFFLEGKWAKQNTDLVKMIFNEGHEIGNHSYSHPDFARLTVAETKKELEETNRIIEAAIGVKPSLFAPPSGSFREETVQIADEMNMQTIMWTVDTIDWRNPPTEVVLNRVRKQVHNGAIILMHPTESTSNALEQILIELKDRGYIPSTISELLDEKRIK